MKTRMPRTPAQWGRAAAVLLVWAGLPLALTACDPLPEGHSSGQLAAQTLGATAATDSDSWDADLARRASEIATLTVQGLDGRSFQVEQRARAIERFPCTNCHVEPLERVKSQVQPGVAATHRNIRQPHPAGARLTCGYCHDDGSGMERLRLRDGATVTINESFRVCAQCHFQQARDWEGGAHGKRLVGWAGQRIVRACAGCHNPHDPLHPVTTKRWPALVPNAPRKAMHSNGEAH